MLKVRNGTKPDGPSLCKSCRNGTIMCSGVNNQEKTYCDSISEYIHMKVTECSSYDDKSQPSRDQMERVAWILYGERGKEIGFMPASEFKKKFNTSTMLPYDD